VRVEAFFSSEAIEFRIRDEGPGFDPGSLPDPTAAENLNRPSGRGIFLIRTFMDHVAHNRTGNQITMIKRRTDCDASAG
jgi:anti-sigma regulatory factor (Ser/Thr protein kinase)